MENIKILECCPNCGDNLTLMESVNGTTHSLWVVKRCLNCGGYPCTEIVKIQKEK